MTRSDGSRAAGKVALGLTSALAAAAVTALIGAATARAEETMFRCPPDEQRVVRLGDPLANHKGKCGKPKVSQRTEEEYVGMKARKIAGGDDFVEKRDIHIEVEEWAYYNLKNHRPRLLRFENGRLAEIRIVKPPPKTPAQEPVAAAAASEPSAPPPVESSPDAQAPDAAK